MITNKQRNTEAFSSPLPQNDYAQELLPYLNWSNALGALEFTCEDSNLLSKQLQQSKALVIGLTGEDLSADNSIAYETLRGHDHPGMCFKYYLKSKCSTTLLKRHCDKIVTSTALVKHRGERQLFLATDFVNWIDEDTGIENQAPLVLFPVQLYYSNQRPGEEYSFILFSDTQLAIENKPLIEKLQNLTKTTFCAFDVSHQQEYLSHISKILQAHTSISLCNKTAVNVLQTNTDQNKPLLAEPFRRQEDKDVNQEFARNLINNRSIEETKVTLQLLIANKEDIFSNKPSSKLFNKQLKDLAQSLLSLGISNLSLRHVVKLPAEIDQWILSIRNMSNSSFIRDWNKQYKESVVMLTSLGKLISLMEHSPSNNAEHYHADHAYKSAVPTLQKAKFQYRLIQTEIDDLKTVLNLDILPSYTDIKFLCETLEDHKSNNPGIVQPEYFSARKQLSSLLCSKTCNYTKQEELPLKRLLKILRVIELFSSNKEYELALGSLFCGLETDWDKLESHIDYSQKLMAVLNSEVFAANILTNWSSMSLTIQENSDILKEGSRAITRITHLLQMPHNSEKNIDELIEMIQKLKPKIATLCNSDPLDSMIKRLNANTIIDLLFSIEQIRDNATVIDTEAQRQIYKAKINSTIDWLNNIIENDHVKPQDIELLISRL